MHTSSRALALLAAFLSTVTAQWNIDPNTVPLSTREQWCSSQVAECPLICLQTPGNMNNAGTIQNTCDPNALSYSCICADGIAPNASEYSQTLPYYLCTQTNNNCVAACGQNNQCAASCVQNNPCGAQNPTRVNTSSIITMSSTASASTGTASGGVVYTGFGDGSAATTTGSQASATGTGISASGHSSGAERVLVGFGQYYGLVVVVTGVFTGFSLL